MPSSFSAIFLHSPSPLSSPLYLSPSPVLSTPSCSWPLCNVHDLVMIVHPRRPSSSSSHLSSTYQFTPFFLPTSRSIPPCSSPTSCSPRHLSFLLPRVVLTLLHRIYRQTTCSSSTTLQLKDGLTPRSYLMDHCSWIRRVLVYIMRLRTFDVFSLLHPYFHVSEILANPVNPLYFPHSSSFASPLSILLTRPLSLTSSLRPISLTFVTYTPTQFTDYSKA